MAMTRKTKYVLLGVAGLGLVGSALVLCAAFVIGVGILAAQAEVETGEKKAAKKTTTKTENKLYKKSDVDALVKFHEWVAEVEFSAEQRERFESFLAKDFERDAAKARTDTDELIKVHDEIRGKDKDTQELTRQILAPTYIEDFRKKKNDPFARFMLGVYEKTGDDESAAEAVEETETASTSGESEITPDLVGKWTRNEGSSNIDPTGKTKYKAGADFIYEFSADGTVKYSMKKEVLTIMQCEIEETKTATGTAAATGETLTLNLGETHFVSSNSCEEAGNFDKNLPAETVSLQWRLKTEYETTRLCLEEADGEKCYDKQSE
jgi:hypothetical protein